MPIATASELDSLAILRDSFALHLSATRRPKTVALYLAALDGLRRHLTTAGMPTSARGIRREHLEHFLAARRERVAPATLSLEYRALAVFFGWLHDEEEIERNPFERMHPPRVPLVPVPVVPVEAFRQLLATAAGTDYLARRDTALLLVFWDTGCRLGEVTGLKVEDVELKERLAYVAGKGGHVRAVRFGGRTAVAIDRYLRGRRVRRDADRPGLWLGQDGSLTSGAIAQMIAKRSARAGLARIHPHQFRHSFAHAFLADGGQETDLQQLAGWRSPLMTRRYGASMAAERARAAYRSPVDRL